ncbi:hypothetical protein [Streptomyces sp. RFCAC02]|uniref:hypothetical protein n=1 Tax=Streptomyces sp. RFCAC02 TaxID=2499143 RepID=UPI00102087EC|nr:hypothetical protein [Streptomyces sp. RFCAC02]
MWAFGTISNHARFPLVVQFPVAAGTRVRGDGLGTGGGLARLAVGTLGVVHLVDGRGVLEIQAGTAQETWAYPADGRLVVDVTVHADGSFTLSGGGRELSGAFRPPVEPGQEDQEGGHALL